MNVKNPCDDTVLDALDFEDVPYANSAKIGTTLTYNHLADQLPIGDSVTNEFTGTYAARTCGSKSVKFFDELEAEVDWITMNA